MCSRPSGNTPCLPVYVVQPWDLDEPHHIVAPQVVCHHPCRQDVPLHRLPPVDADAHLCMLVLAGL